jgi:uncharacterized membrane protein
MGVWQKFIRIARHLWLDQADARKAVPHAMAERLSRRVGASEKRHSGEVRICVEAALPMSYLWRSASPRERAIALFGKLRIWDTAQNNGALIYLLLADHAIEIVADRGLNDVVSAVQWQAMASRLGAALQAQQFEDGLTQALEELSALLVTHFPTQADTANSNELPDVVVML